VSAEQIATLLFCVLGGPAVAVSCYVLALAYVAVSGSSGLSGAVRRTGAVRWPLALALVVGVLGLGAGSARAGLVVGSGCMAMVCNNSHMLVNVSAEPFPFVDKSPSARVVTNTSVAQSAAQVKFGAQSLEYSAGTDSLSVPDSSAWLFPADFCISLWEYHAAPTAGSAYFSSQRNVHTAHLFYARVTDDIRFVMGNAADVLFLDLPAGVNTIPAGGWNQATACRSGSTARLFVNGRQVAIDGTATGVVSDEGVSYTLGFGGSALVGYRDSWMTASRCWVWTRNHSPSNRRM
jgi:hypothetical protein